MHVSLGCMAQADHAASHIGVATGLVNAIRGLPFHSSRRQRYIPSSVLHAHGISDHDLFMFFHRAALKNADEANKGSEGGSSHASPASSGPDPDEVAQAIGNCVFDVASTAHAHLEHALQLQPSVPAEGIPALSLAVSWLHCFAFALPLSPSLPVFILPSIYLSHYLSLSLSLSLSHFMSIPFPRLGVLFPDSHFHVPETVRGRWI